MQSTTSSEATIREIEWRHKVQVDELQEQLNSLQEQLQAETRAKETWKKKFTMLLQLVK
jgi:hypothetical protein